MSHTCERHEPGTHTCYWNCGCRCRACCFTNSTYDRDRRRGVLLNVPVEQVAPMVDELNRSGWTLASIADEVGCTWQNVSRIRNRRYVHVRRSTAQAIADLHSSLDLEQTVDGTRLAAAIRATGHPVSRLLPDDADRKAFYRAEAGHRLAHHVADRLSVRALGEPLTTYYPVEVA